MRLQLVGNYSLDEFEAAISKVVEKLKANEINSFQNVNIYLRTCVNGSEVRFTNEGREVEHLVFDFTEKRRISIKAKEVSVVDTHHISSKTSEED